MFGVGEALRALGEFSQPTVIMAAGGLTLAECTLGVGLFVPGETGLLVAAATVTNAWAFALMTSVVAGCAVAGDTLGFWLGHRYGHRLRESRVVGKIGRSHWDRATDLLRRHGAGAVFVARFLPVVRTLTPAAAGASELTFRRFLPASVAGAVCWSTLHVGIGAGAGASARYIEDWIGRASWIVLAAIVLIAAGAAAWRRRSRQRSSQANLGSSEEHNLVTRTRK